MTTPARAKRNSTPLTADQITKKVRAIYASQALRIAELKREDEIAASKLLGRAQDEDEHAAARAMLSAVGIVVTEEEYEPTAEELAAAADATDEPDDPPVQPQGEQELPRGAQPYVPGAAARAARGSR